MAKEKELSRKEQLQLQSIQEEIAQEFSKRENLDEENQKLLDTVPELIEQKKESLKAQENAIAQDARQISVANMNEEIKTMGDFSAEVDRFNDQHVDYLVAIKALKKLIKEDA